MKSHPWHLTAFNGLSGWAVANLIEFFKTCATFLYELTSGVDLSTNCFGRPRSYFLASPRLAKMPSIATGVIKGNHVYVLS